MPEDPVEVTAIITRLVFVGDDCRRIVGILRYLAADQYPPKGDGNWARAVLEEIRQGVV